MARTNIEWSEVVWNPVTGCTKISPGCKNCYAETIANRFWKDRKFTDVVCHEDRLEQPLHWKKPRMIFVNSMSDLFHKDIPFVFIDKIFDIMVTTPRHTYQILTKRPERMLEYCMYQDEKMRSFGYGGFIFPDFIWMGTSVENQKEANERIPILLQIPAKVKWISAEPLLEPIDLIKIETKNTKIHWVVVGGESGPKARPCNIFWIKEIVGICKIQNIPVFVKQLGSKPYYEGDTSVFSGVKIIFDGNGKNDKIENFPEDLQIREYPKEKK
jgi:protein gp37